MWPYPNSRNGAGNRRRTNERGAMKRILLVIAAAAALVTSTFAVGASAQTAPSASLAAERSGGCEEPDVITFTVTVTDSEAENGVLFIDVDGSTVDIAGPIDNGQFVFTDFGFPEPYTTPWSFMAEGDGQIGSGNVTVDALDCEDPEPTTTTTTEAPTTTQAPTTTESPVTTAPDILEPYVVINEAPPAKPVASNKIGMTG